MRLLVLLVMLAALPSPAAAQETADLRDWWAACDERRTCWAFGASEDGPGAAGFVRIERGGAATAPPTMVLGVWLEGEHPAAATMRVSVDGKPGPVLTARRDDDSEHHLARVTDPEAARALAAAIRDGRRLTLRLDRVAGAAEVSLTGGAAALLWMDDRQKRAGTVTALARPGPAPASAVPPVPPRRVVRAAPQADQRGVPQTWAPAVLRRPEVRACLEEMSSDELRVPEVARLDAKTVLWGVPCSQGAYQTAHLFFLADAAGRGWRPAPFEPSEGENYVTMASFDPETMTLSGFAKGRGLADCGVGNAWVWTGRAFVRTYEQAMMVCRGVPQSLWPVIVDAEVR